MRGAAIPLPFKAGKTDAGDVEPAMVWRFWSAWCGPYKRGYRVVTARVNERRTIGERFSEGHSISPLAKRFLRKARFIKPASPAKILSWRETHKPEWRKLDRQKLGQRALKLLAK